ncbi:MAG TPA: hypothetical protein VFY37_03705 [Solirubrobacterales bacterium]|nr:hypothetical protein [Solirubrobacterales bacterium]
MATAAPSSIGARPSLSAWIDGPPAREIAPATRPAVAQVGVRSVGDRVELEHGDVALDHLDLGHGGRLLPLS